jgi:uncharacterized membrane protein
MHTDTFHHNKQILVVTLLLIVTQVPLLWISDVTFKHLLYVLVCIVVLPTLLFRLTDIRIPSPLPLFITLLSLYIFGRLAYEGFVHYAGLRSSEDTAAFTQCFWTMIHKGSFSTTIDGQYSLVAPETFNHFGRHSSPILFLVLIPFGLFEGPMTLLAVKAILWAITGWLAFDYCRHVMHGSIQNAGMALLPFVLLLQLPFLLLTDFAEVVFYPPLILWSALAFHKHKRTQFALSCIATALVKETAAGILFMWTAVALIRRRDKFYSIIPSLVGVVAAAISFLVIIPHYNRGSASPFLTEIPYAWNSLNTGIVGAYVLKSISCWGWMPIMSPLSLLCLPDVAANAFYSGQMPWAVALKDRWQLSIMTILFVATLDSLPTMAKYLNKRFALRNGERLLLVLLLSISSISLFRAGPTLHHVWNHFQKNWRSDRHCIEQLEHTTDPVVAERTLCGYFATRERIWTTSEFLPDSTYREATWCITRRDSLSRLSAVAGWNIVCEGATIVVLKRPGIPPSTVP